MSLTAITGLLLCPIFWGAAAEEGGSVSFSRQIAPIFFQKCQACHGLEKSKGDFRLHTYSDLLRGGESKKPVITPNDPEKSHLFHLITTPDQDDRMPQKDEALLPEQIALIKTWIEQGAAFDGSDPATALSRLIPAPPNPPPPKTYPHPIPLSAIAFRPNSKELAVAGYHEITIWHWAEGELLRRITNVAERVQSLVWQREGGVLISGGGAPGRAGEIKMIDLVEGQRHSLAGSFGEMILGLALNQAGGRLAAGGGDNAIRVYYLESRKQEALIEQHSDWVMALAFSHDGSKIASGSRDKTARVFQSQTGEMQTSYQGHNAAIYTVSFSADDKRVFSGGADRKIHSWNPEDGKKVGESDLFLGEVYRVLTAGDKVFSCAEKRIREHRSDNLKTVREYIDAPHDICSLSYDEPGKHLAAGTFNGEIIIWQEGNPKPILVFTALPGRESIKRLQPPIKSEARNPKSETISELK